MTSRHLVVTSAALFALVAALHGQTATKTPSGEPTVKTEQLTGEVVTVKGNALVVKMQPDGSYRTFHVPPEREFVIDGQTKHLGDLKPGTVLTATVTTTTQPVTVRTTNSLSGTVFWVSGNYVVLNLDNGETKGYTVPESYKFTVEGKPATVHELKKDMKVTATKIVEDPQVEMSTKTVVTGKAPKAK
jgi:hypothetical protein